MGFAPADPAASQPNVSAATMNLNFALMNPHLSDDELGPFVTGLREARARARQRLDAAQAELNLLPVEEAKLVNLGVIQ
jgi:hypothetical protein